MFETASEQARRIRDKEISASELLALHIARIEHENPRLNAIVTLDLQRATERARTLDAALMRGELVGPLHGVPFTLKDCHRTAGVRTTVGAPQFQHHVPDRDGSVTRRLLAAGAILVGKTNVPPMLMSAQTNNPIFGRSNNPWNVERTTGGSSGGAGAAVAAGLVPFDIGSDMSGSIRMPASFCGIFGLKPSVHRVPLTGHIPPPPGVPRPDRVLGVVGPMARSVEDLELLMSVLSGPDGEDVEVPPVPWTRAEQREARSLRLAWLPVFPDVPTSAAVKAETGRVAAALTETGATLVEREPGFALGAMNDVWREYFRLGSGVFMELAGAKLPVEAPDAKRASPTDWVRVHDQRDRLVSELERLLEEFDAFLCPTTITTAFPHSAPRSPIPVDGVEVESRFVDHYLYPWNLTGHPALAIPTGIAEDGLPLSVQLIGRRWGDERLLAVGRALAEVTGGLRSPPVQPP
jgi:amidase